LIVHSVGTYDFQERMKLVCVSASHAANQFIGQRFKMVTLSAAQSLPLDTDQTTVRRSVLAVTSSAMANNGCLESA